MKHRIIIIAALTPQGVIGKDNDLPWPFGYLKGDLTRFRDITTGHTVLMGRKTYESIPEPKRPLPNRFNMIVGNDPAWWASMPDTEQVKKFRNIAQAVHWFEGSPPISELEAENGEKILFLTGGSRIFREGLETGIISEMILTETKEEFPGDVYFPEFDNTLWQTEIIAETEQYIVKRYFK